MLSPGRVAAAVTLALLLAGCGKHYWNKPGAGFAEFTQDSQACAKEHALYMSGNKDYGIVSAELYRGCLRARGWTRAQQQEPAPPGWFRGFESEDVVKLDAPPPQAEPATSQSELPTCPRGATIAMTRDAQGRPMCRP